MLLRETHYKYGFILWIIYVKDILEKVQIIMCNAHNLFDIFDTFVHLYVKKLFKCMIRVFAFLGYLNR